MHSSLYGGLEELVKTDPDLQRSCTELVRGLARALRAQG